MIDLIIFCNYRIAGIIDEVDDLTESVICQYKLVINNNMQYRQ